MEELIRKRAYEIYIRRTQSELWDYGNRGTAWGDWLQAEREIQKEYSAVTNRIKNLV